MPYITLERARQEYRGLGLRSGACLCDSCLRTVAANGGYEIGQTDPEYQTPEKPLGQYIAAMGLEIEGGWFEEPERLAHDGSVGGLDGAMFTGESVSPPFDNFNELVAFLRNNYPDKVNSTCGLHVHFSLTKQSHYSAMMEQAFWDHYRLKMKEWAAIHLANDANFWHRFNGDNRYCRNVFNPGEQVLQRSKCSPRYAQWNFCHSLHRTVECRLLPTFPQCDTALAAIRALRNIVTTYLRNASRKPLPEESASLSEAEAMSEGVQLLQTVQAEVID